MQQQRMPKTRAIEHDKTWQDLRIPAAATNKNNNKIKKQFHSFLNSFSADETRISIAQLKRSTWRMRNERAYAPLQVLRFAKVLKKYMYYVCILYLYERIRISMLNKLL